MTSIHLSLFSKPGKICPKYLVKKMDLNPQCFIAYNSIQNVFFFTNKIQTSKIYSIQLKLLTSVKIDNLMNSNQPK